MSSITLEQRLNSCPFLSQFDICRDHAFATEVGNRKILNDFVVAISATDRVGINNAWLNAIAAVRRYTHADPIVTGCA